MTTPATEPGPQRETAGPAKAQRQRRQAGGRSCTVEVKLSEADKAEITARARAAAVSIPRLLAQAALACGAPAIPTGTASAPSCSPHARPSPRCGARSTGSHRPHQAARCYAAAPQIAALAGEIDTILSQLAYRTIQSGTGSSLGAAPAADRTP
jgi:hypothetical protein